MKKLTIGLDIDGVIADTVSVMLPFLSRVCQRQITHQDITTYNLENCLAIVSQTMENIWKQILANGLLLHAPAIKGALQGITECQHHEIWLVTARPSSIRETTLSWLKGKKVKYDHIVFDTGRDKHLVTSGFDIFVDDFLEIVRPIAEAGTFTLLFDQPWNQTPELPQNCRRVYDWKTVVQVIDELERA
jgi:uncharacterized HAD superfamily protein